MLHELRDEPRLRAREVHGGAIRTALATELERHK
jgi:hypothetical protein